MRRNPGGPTQNVSAFQNALRLEIIPGLDAIRAAAVSMVVLMQFWLPAHGHRGTGRDDVLRVERLFDHANPAHRILKPERSRYASFIAAAHFASFLIFYACWLLETLLITLHREHIHWWEPWASFFYLSDYARAVAGPETVRHMVVAWSLAIEEQFYLLWPAVLLWMLLSRKNVYPRRYRFYCLRVGS